MSASAVEQILRMWACLEPHGPAWPGKPPKMRVEVPLGRKKLLAVTDDQGHVVGHYRAACGATQTQTRSRRMDGFSPLDVAAAAGSALRQLDPEYRALFEFVTGAPKPGTREYLVCELSVSLIAEARWRRWEAIDRDRAERIAELVLRMLMDADACRACNTQGHIVDPDGRKVTCDECRGSGHVAYPERQIAAEWAMPQATYHRKFAPAVAWAHALLQGRASTIVAAMRGELDSGR